LPRPDFLSENIMQHLPTNRTNGAEQIETPQAQHSTLQKLCSDPKAADDGMRAMGVPCPSSPCRLQFSRDPPIPPFAVAALFQDYMRL